MRWMLVVAVAALAAVEGCEAGPVQWDGSISSVADSLGALTISPTGVAGFQSREVPQSLPVDSARCERSIAVARDGASWYAAWFSRRPNTSVAVLAARSIDSGRTWSTARMVDSVDVAKVGCERPAPSIAASAGSVHIVYSLEAPEGFGVFYAHSMDGTATFHSEAPVIYGDRLSATSTAADSMNVVVAYEDPSGSGHRVDVALSVTQGHSFEPRQRASPSEMSATRPDVAVSGTVVALSFTGQAGSGRVVRIGHIH